MSHVAVKLVSLFFLVLVLLAPMDLSAKSKQDKKQEKKTREAQKQLKMDRREVQNTRDIRKNVHRRNGEVWVDGIPMIDQGNRDTCAIATVRRILCYYADCPPNRCPIDERTLKDALGYSRGGGTNMGIMLSALQMNASRLHLDFGVLYNMPALPEIISDYNRACASTGSHSKKLDDSREAQARGLISYGKDIDYNTWKRVRNQDDNAKKRAWKSICECVDNGFPVMWSVFLGLLPEKGANTKNPSGHLRIIIGYDAGNKDIIYTDSWGSGHAKKKMRWNDAWAISTTLFLLSPR